MKGREFEYIDRPPTAEPWRAQWLAVIVSDEGHPVATMPEKTGLYDAQRAEYFSKLFAKRMRWGVMDPIKGLVLPERGDRFQLHPSGAVLHVTFN